jgi:hypothetical protein
MRLFDDNGASDRLSQIGRDVVDVDDVVGVCIFGEYPPGQVVPQFSDYEGKRTFGLDPRKGELTRVVVPERGDGFVLTNRGLARIMDLVQEGQCLSTPLEDSKPRANYTSSGGGHELLLTRMK